ncbi:MAG: hypothetical protein ACKVP0_07440 [Pirellulaceae bacterium]
MKRYQFDDDVIEGSVRVQGTSENGEPMHWSQEVTNKRRRNEQPMQVNVDISPILPMLVGALFLVSVALLLMTLFVVGVL